MRHILIVLLLTIAAVASAQLADTVRASLLTCYPGKEIFELCGHQALRLKTATSDSVWNFGVFSFNEPNFIYRFVKGETDYMLAGEPTKSFKHSYSYYGRKIVEQDLNLTPQEAAHLRDMIRENALPQNCRYRYNYVKDNCATRIIAAIDSATSPQLRFPEPKQTTTFRQAMRDYHRNYPWYQFGIDLALGSGIDYPLTTREETFAPMRTMELARSIHFADGRPLITAERVLVNGIDLVLPPTPFYLTPMAVALLVLVISLLTIFHDTCRLRIWRPVYSIYFLIAGLAGCLSAYLVFVSSHEATSPNIVIFWLNPLSLIFSLTIWMRRLKTLSVAIAAVNLLTTGIVMIIWPFTQQSPNVAFYPLMITGMALSATYCYVTVKTWGYSPTAKPDRKTSRKTASQTKAKK